jgi:hypothetical protein
MGKCDKASAKHLSGGLVFGWLSIWLFVRADASRRARVQEAVWAEEVEHNFASDERQRTISEEESGPGD